jgi:pyruvate dehydrogenase (quinone)
VPVYTDLKRPDFGVVAKATPQLLFAARRVLLRRQSEKGGELTRAGAWGHSISKAGGLEESVRTWLAQHGPAMLRVNVKPMQLVTPPSRFVLPEAVAGMAVYTARAILHGKGGDVWEMMAENIPDRGRDRKTGVSQGERQCLTRQSHWLSSQLFFWAWSRAVGSRSL